jgi:hypothetical protein
LGLNVPIQIHNVLYVPTLTGAVFGEHMEISRESGTSIFKSLGVDVSHCKTISQIKSAISLRLAQPSPDLWVSSTTVHRMSVANRTLLIIRDREIRTKLYKCTDALMKLSSKQEDCAICYENTDEQCLIHPCFHYICKTCMTSLIESRPNSSCPLCRANVSGVTEVDESENADGNDICTNEPLFTIDPNAMDMNTSLQIALETPQSLLQSLTIILQHLEMYAMAEEGDEPYRVLVAVPENIDFNELKESVPIIKRFIIHGNPSAPISAKKVSDQINNFKQTHGTKVRILFTSEGKKDHLSGLDFDNTDCLISVGNGNTIQRVGRLARLGRNYSRGKVLYFKLNQRW